MMKTSKSKGLQKLAAAFGAAVLASAMMAPAAFAEYPEATTDTDSPVNWSDETQTQDDTTQIWLRVVDDAQRTLSVTAPLKIYLGAQYDSNTTDLDCPFIAPSANATYIQNYSKAVNLEVKKWTSTSLAGTGDTAKAEAVAERVYGNGVDSYTIDDDAGKYYLNAIINNGNSTVTAPSAGTSTTLGTNNSILAIADQTSKINLGASSGTDYGETQYETKQLYMAQNTGAVEKAAGTFLPLELQGRIFAPDGTQNGFGQDDGAGLVQVVWTFGKSTE